MGMSIDKAISWLLTIAEHEGEDIPIYDTDVEAIKMAIEIMRKYQQIEEIYKNWCYPTQINAVEAMNKLGEVLKDGKA